MGVAGGVSNVRIRLGRQERRGKRALLEAAASLTLTRTPRACRITTLGAAMGLPRRVQRLTDACTRVGKYQPHELLRWLVGDVLADFGARHTEPPPQEVLPWLRDTAGEYARAVAEHPYGDVLGVVYQELGSRGHRSALGQFF